MFGSGKAEGRVGVLSESPHSGSALTVAGIGAVHEFGSPTQNIPRRSFLASTVDKNAKKYTRELEKVTNAALDAVEATPEEADSALTVMRQRMRVFAEGVRADVIKTINSNVPPPLSPAYAARKGDNITLIDTGQLRDSIAAEIRMGDEVVRSGQ